MSKLERTAFEFSRAREYFELKELSTLTGQEPETLAAVVLKEVVDNALDGCEMAGVAPYITVEVDGDVAAVDGEIRMSVTDNGGGIPPEVVAKVLDYNIRVSDKSAYRSPTRGAQGNALKTVVGIPHALGGRAGTLRGLESPKAKTAEQTRKCDLRRLFGHGMVSTYQYLAFSIAA